MTLKGRSRTGTTCLFPKLRYEFLPTFITRLIVSWRLSFKCLFSVGVGVGSFALEDTTDVVYKY